MQKTLFWVAKIAGGNHTYLTHLCVWVRERTRGLALLLLFSVTAELTFSTLCAIVVTYICVVPEWAVRADISGIVEVKSQVQRTSRRASRPNCHVGAHIYHHQVRDLGGGMWYAGVLYIVVG
jgi:hypothetical protein